MMDVSINARPHPSAGFYYGWINLSVAALAMVATLPGRTVGLGLVTEALLASLALDRVSFGTINLVATLIGALFSIGCGRLIDSWGVRVVLTANAFLLGACVLWMARVHGYWDLLISLTLVRGLGQSALSVVSIAIVGKWFVHRLNRAMAIYSAALAIGFIVAIPTLEQVLKTADWRAVWADVGYGILGLSLLAALLVRATPEAFGIPANHEELQPPPRDPTEAGRIDYTLGQTLQLPIFWAFALSAAMFNLIFSGITLFSQGILRERGFNDPGTFTVAMGVLALGGIAANFLGGLLANRIPLQKLMALGMLTMTGALLLLPLWTSKAALLTYASLMGVSGGVVTVVFFACWPRVFGRRHLGQVQGAAQVLAVLFSAAGPLLLALGEQRQGSISRTFLFFAPIVAMLAVTCWFIKSPGVTEQAD